LQTRLNVLLASSRSVAGLLDHSDLRLSDFLNSRLQSVLRLTDARLGRLGNERANDPVEVAVVPKSQVALVYSQHELVRPAERRISSFVPKQTTGLLVLVAGLRVRGHAHATAVLDPVELHRLIADRESRFVVLTDARISLDVEGVTEREVGVVMVNVVHIQFVAHDATVAKSATAADPQPIALAAE
jgi:hypothetical protein